MLKRRAMTVLDPPCTSPYTICLYIYTVLVLKKEGKKRRRKLGFDSKCLKIEISFVLYLFFSGGRNLESNLGFIF